MQTMLMLMLVPLVFTLCTLPASGQSESEVRTRLVGTWKLVSTEETLKDGATRPFRQFGAHGKGFLMYQADGYMCANLVNPDRPKWANSSQASKEEAVVAGEGTFAYCGRYEINVEKQQIIHLPEIATNPAYVGSRQIRPYRFEGGKLILSDVEKDDAEVASWKIVWEKVK
jgi:Lipocalin-like domain